MFTLAPLTSPLTATFGTSHRRAARSLSAQATGRPQVQDRHRFTLPVAPRGSHAAAAGRRAHNKRFGDRKPPRRVFWSLVGHHHDKRLTGLIDVADPAVMTPAHHVGTEPHKGLRASRSRCRRSAAATAAVVVLVGGVRESSPAELQSGAQQRWPSTIRPRRRAATVCSVSVSMVAEPSSDVEKAVKRVK